MNFKIETLPFGDFESVKITSLISGDILTVCNYGATVTSYTYITNQGAADILVPYHSPEQLIKGEAAVNWIMAPFSNRMREGTYSFNGRSYHLNDQSGKSHGMARKMIFKIEEIGQTEEEVIIKYHTQISPEMFSAYPFHTGIAVTYRFRNKKLGLSIEGTNLGTDPLPFGCGWHPYFYSGGQLINSFLLYIPSEEVVVTDQQLVPLQSNHIKKISSDDILYFADPSPVRMIGDSVVNACYTNLKPGQNGLIESVLTDTINKTAFRIFQERGVFYAYTPESLRGEKRKSIALEPVEFITDAFNRDELKDQIVLLPGEKRSFEFGIIRESL